MAERGKGFPRISLSSAVQIMESAQKFGKSWTKEQFAGFGAKANAGSHKSGAFMARLSALRDYGLITTDKDNVTATDLAQIIAKPINDSEREKSVREAFLSVATFRQVYESLDVATALPRDKFAEYAVTVLGVSRDSMDRFVNVFIDSGMDARLVSYSKESKEITLMGRSEQTVDQGVETQDIPEKQEAEASNSSLGIFVPKPPMTIDQSFDSNAAMNEQGVNHAGSGWALTVLVKTGHRLPLSIRKEIRELLDQADAVADKLYDLEDKDQ